MADLVCSVPENVLNAICLQPLRAFKYHRSSGSKQFEQLGITNERGWELYVGNCIH